MASQRQDLLLRKLVQCQVIFDFNNPRESVKGKEIKRKSLEEILEYIMTSRGVLTDAVYPEIIRLVTIPSRVIAEIKCIKKSEILTMI